MFDTRDMQQLLSYMAKSKARRTQEQWAEVFGISRSYLSEIMSGKVQPGRKTIQKISEATGGKVAPSSWFERERA